MERVDGCGMGEIGAPTSTQMEFKVVLLKRGLSAAEQRYPTRMT